MPLGGVSGNVQFHFFEYSTGGYSSLTCNFRPRELRQWTEVQAVYHKWDEIDEQQPEGYDYEIHDRYSAFQHRLLSRMLHYEAMLKRTRRGVE